MQFINVTAMSICLGMSTAAETLCSQVLHRFIFICKTIIIDKFKPIRPMGTRILGKLALYCKEVVAIFFGCNKYYMLLFLNRNFNTCFDYVPYLGLLA